MDDAQLANISGYISENQGLTIKEADFAFLKGLRTPPVFEKADKLLRRAARKFPTAGERIFVDYTSLDVIFKAIEQTTDNQYPNDSQLSKSCPRILPWVSAAWAKNSDEFAYIWWTFLHEFMEYLRRSRTTGQTVITPKGWSHLETLNSPAVDSSKAFVAMWFDASVHPAWLEAIKPAIEDAGYEAIRIDKKEHNNRIDDEIVAGIRACKFLIADFTGQRGGVYFESGFAQGLGKQVIWLCREDNLNEIHFDTRQYNFILWKSSDLPALKIALKNRIEATIGKAV